jgi:L-ribulokinase
VEQKYAIGLDFGTNSARCLIVRLSDGFEAGTFVSRYKHGEKGVILSQTEPELARQHPDDYLQSLPECVLGAIEQAKSSGSGFRPDLIVGIGVAATSSTPIPVDEQGIPLALNPKFSSNPNALAWLWKDHTSYFEAEVITRKATELRPQYLLKYGVVYQSEWFWSKVWRCLNVDPKVYEAAYTWVELADWIPAVLTGTTHPSLLKRNICTAGHKAMYNDCWGGLPDEEFLNSLDLRLGALRKRLYDKVYTIQDRAGELTSEWAEKLGLPVGLPVAIGVSDGHIGAVGAGIKPGTMVRIIGTSSSDFAVVPNNQPVPDIPGLCGIVDSSIIPSYTSLEAGQSAVGDIYNWFVDHIQPGRANHEGLTEKASKLKPGESGLVMLDWLNGNRSILSDPRLSGLIIGLNIQTTPAEIYRALIEGTAFGARAIMEHFAEYGFPTKEVIYGGGIAEKNPMLLQIYADITGCPMKIARTGLASALGASITGAVASGSYKSVEEAQSAMCAIKETLYHPIPEHQAIYQQLYSLYKTLHDAFGTLSWSGNLSHVMKRLLDIRDRERGS